VSDGPDSSPEEPRRRLPALARRLGIGVLGALVLVGALVITPTALRRDTSAFEFDGEIGRGTLEEPIGVAISGGRLFVTDAATNRLVVFEFDGTMVEAWDGGALGLRRPMHVSTGPDGTLYVADYLTDQVVVIDTTGQRIRQVGGQSGSGPGDLDAPGGAAVLGTQVLAADFYNHRVEPIGSPGAPRIGRAGRVLGGRLNYPTDVAVADSLVYVADAYNNRVQVFSAAGGALRKWGGPFGLGIPGKWRGWFRVAAGVEVVGDVVYVADFFNNRIQLFDRQGRYQGQIPDSLRMPTDVAVGPDGVLFVADFGNGRVARFRHRTP